MKRRLLNLLTVLSLLLCVAVVSLWIRSHWLEDWICHRRLHATLGHRAGATDWMFSTSRGIVHTGVSVVGWDTRLFDFGWYAGDGWRWESDRAMFVPTRMPNGLMLNRLGFAYDWFDPTPDDDTWSRDVALPLWLPAALFALLPAARGYRRAAAASVIRPATAAGAGTTCAPPPTAAPSAARTPRAHQLTPISHWFRDRRQVFRRLNQSFKD